MTNTNNDNLLFIKQLEQTIERYQRTNINIALHFIKAGQLNEAINYLKGKVAFKLIGGYQDALSKRLVIGQDINEYEYVSCLKARFNNKYNKLTHRDVLGALYNLQIQNDRLGDLWVEDDCIYLYCEKELENFLCLNFTQVGHNNIKFEPVTFREQIFKFDEFKINVSSLRLDNIVSDIIRKSREKTKIFIHDDMVRVNYQTIEDCDYLCNNKDVLSLTSIGRFIIDNIEINNKTKKYIVFIKKFK